MYIYVCNSCNMDTSDLPDMYALSPRTAICMPKVRGPPARGLRAYILGKSRVPMLQLIYNTFLASCVQAKSSVELQQLYLV